MSIYRLYEDPYALEKQLADAKKEFAKSSATMVVIASFMALIAQGFKWLYNKDDEDELKDLKEQAKEIGIKGYTKMNREELEEAIKNSTEK